MTAAVDAEIPALIRCLQQERDHVLGAVEGLSDGALRRLVLPSGWNCLGMVQHLTQTAAVRAALRSIRVCGAGGLVRVVCPVQQR